MENPYKVLGLSPTASLDEVKAAYKKLAKQYHPDLNPNNPAAEEVFKRISSAYETIISGKSKPNNNFNYKRSYREDFIFDEFFTDVFNKSFREHANRRKEFYNENINANVKITLEDIFYGAEKHGKIQFPDGEIKNIVYNVPKYYLNKVVCLRQQGPQKNKNLPAGDIVLKLELINHPTFKIVENQEFNSALLLDLKINVLELMIGTEKEIQTICGSLIKLKIPPSNTNILKIPEKGLWKKDMTRGDLLINIVPDIPKITNSESIELIKKILVNGE